MNENVDRLAGLIADKIRAHKDELTGLWNTTGPIQHCFLDDVLPADEVLELSRKFPNPKDLMTRSSMREHKKVGINLDDYDPVIKDFQHAFQHQKVIDAVEEITEIPDLVGDPSFYASGISVMETGDFLNPHLDNSHDGDQKKYRVLNILFYVSPDWKLENGGNLELWDADITESQTLVSKFNRLAIMLTDDESWHSVSKVTASKPRLCISNYYFGEKSPIEKEFSHVTSFAGYPGEKLKRPVLKVDSALRNLAGKIFPFLIRRTKHRKVDN